MFLTYVIEKSFLFSFTLIINDTMKRKHSSEKDSKSKKPSMGSIHGPGLATSTSTLITSTTDLKPSIPASDSDGTASAVQVTAGVSVSVQLRQSPLKVLTYCHQAERL